MPTPALLSVLLCVPSLFAQAIQRLEFTEVLVDPIGTNAGTQLVELRNTGNLAVDLSGWRLVTTAGAFVLPPFVVAPDTMLVVHPGAAGTNGAGHLYLPAVPTLATSDALALFRSAAVQNPLELVDFVAWGGGQATMAIAVQAGEWPNPADTVLLPNVAGHSIAHYDEVTYGSRNGSAAWFTDGTPTLGARNDGGGIFAAGYGCPLLLAGPQIGSGADDNRPWIGSTWRLTTSYLPVTPAWLWVAIGLGATGPVPLDPFGIPGCQWEAAPDAVLLRHVTADPDAIFIDLPADPLLVGYRLHVQALVPATGNAGGWLPTRELIAIPGSR